MRVGVPVEGENLRVVERTGQAPFFAIFDIEGEGFTLVMLRSLPAHSEHHHEHHHEHHEHKNEHKRQVDVISDCEFALLKRVGEHMREAFDNAGIKIKMFRQKDGELASDYVRAFIAKSRD